MVRPSIVIGERPVGLNDVGHRDLPNNATPSEISASRPARLALPPPRSFPVSGGELNKSFPIEAHAMTRAHWCDCHALFQDQWMLDVPIKPKSVRLEVRTIWA